MSRPRTSNPFSRFRQNRLALAGLALIVIMYLGALLAPVLAPYAPDESIDLVNNRGSAPSGSHLLGTDRYARDIFSRLLFGARISLTVGLAAVALSLAIGTLVGLLAGQLGGWVDTLLMRLVDLLISFPRLVLLLAVAAFFNRSILLIMVLLGLTGWMTTARVIRGEILALREREFVLAAGALGASPARVALRHLLPNCLAPLVVTATLGLGQTILVEAGLSFLGLGVPPPTASWGSMVNEGRHLLLEAPWITTFPGLAIVCAVLCFNLVGDALRDAFDPRLGGVKEG
jgi:peptide/nickel transport system permease protein